MNCITIIITLEGIEISKTQKKKRQQNSLKNVSFTNAVRKRQQTHGLIYVLARQILHFSS